MGPPITHVANGTDHKLGVEVKWANGGDAFRVVEPAQYVAVETGNSDIIIIVRSMETGKEVATRRVDPWKSVVVKYVGGEYRLYHQLSGANSTFFTVDPSDMG